MAAETGKALDKLDLKLLGWMQRDNQLTAEELAERVPLSPSAIARRLRGLRERKLIAADISVLAEGAAGPMLSAVVQIQLERHALAEVERFRRRLAASDNVQLCLEVSGGFDIMLLVVVPDMEGYNDFADTLLAGERAVRRYETSFVKKRLKASLAVPLE